MLSVVSLGPGRCCVYVLTNQCRSLLSYVCRIRSVVAASPVSAERMSFAKIMFGIQVLVNAIIDFGGVTAILTRLTLDLPYSRRLELEADAIGLSLMAAACYDPAASPRMFTRLAALNKGGSGAAARLLSTHPVFDDRIARLQTALPPVRKGFVDRCGITDFSQSMRRHRR